MHPMERLRHLARAGPLDHAVLVYESAVALASLGDDGAALLLACRRLLQRHPASGPLWWLCARMACADDAVAEVWRCVAELDDDPTPTHVSPALAEDATVVILGWPEVAAQALAGRPDLRVLVVDARGEAGELARRLRAMEVDAVEVEEAATAAAVLASDAVVLEAAALGAVGFVAVAGSRAAAAVAGHAGVPVELVAGAGRRLPPGLWAAAEARLGSEEPWWAPQEVVPLDLVDTVVRPHGRSSPADLLARSADCPDAPELR